MQQFKTPPIPGDIKNLRTPDYKNIFEFNLGNENLFGTETLLGDWDGRVLAVAKDFAPVDAVQALQTQGVDPQLIYRDRYRMGYRTNSRLLRFMYGGDADGLMIDGSCNMNCGALYISACFFLKIGCEASSSLNHWKPGCDVFEKSASVFRFVISNMPNLKAIACLGKEAQSLVRSAVTGPDRPLGTYRIYDHAHPSRGSNAAHEKSWRYMFDDAGIFRAGTQLRPLL